MIHRKLFLRPNFLILLSGFIFLNCSDTKEDDCSSTREAFFLEVSAPDSASIDEEVAIATSFSVINGCGSFDRFIETGTATDRIIELQVKYVGCVCTQNVPILDQDYLFKADRQGIYKLNFKSGLSDFIAISINVN